jgi:DeoR family fructose operon transcriptional repressor
VIRLLSQRPDIRIVTNNVAAVMSLPDETEAEILLLGGRFRSASGCVVGDWARRLLDEIAPSRAILGVDGLSLKEGLSSPIPEEAAITRLMMERTRGPLCVVADHHKIGRVCGFRIGALSGVDELISDGEDGAPWREDFESAGLRVTLGAPEVSQEKQEMER